MTALVALLWLPLPSSPLGSALAGSHADRAAADGAFPAVTRAAAGVVALSAPSAALQDQRYRERQVLDPETGEWKDEAPPVEGTPEGDLALARSLLAQGQSGKARTVLQRWLKQNPEDERYTEGVFLLGEAEFERRDYWAAYKQYNYVVENAGGELYSRAVRREMDVARAFLAGQKRIVWKIFRLPAQDDGVEILDRVWEQVPGTRMGEDALRLKANYHFDRGDMDLAQDQYVTLAREYPNGRFAQFAMLRSAESANAAFAGTRFDVRPLLEAEERYRQMQAAYPAYAEREQVPQRLDGIHEKRAEKDVDIGRWYLRRGRRDAAEFYFRHVVRQWPETLSATDARNELRRLGVETEPPAAPAIEPPAPAAPEAQLPPTSASQPSE